VQKIHLYTYRVLMFHLPRWIVKSGIVARSGKTGGPFETSITGTCHFVDVVTASEFVIMLPCSLSLSLSLSLLIIRIFGLARSWSAGRNTEFLPSSPDLHWGTMQFDISTRFMSGFIMRFYHKKNNIASVKI